MGKRILIVDDSVYMRSLIKFSLTENGFDVVGEAEDGASAIELTRQLKPDLITLDNMLPDMMGHDILKVFQDEGIETKVIIVSAVKQQTVVNKGKELGALDYIVKPFSTSELVTALNNVL